MNTCNECNNPCKKGCKPARYSQGFPSCSTVFDAQGETDTKLSLDVSGATLNYAAERHTDVITGQQLGSIINLPDLRDVNFDYDFDAMCAEFIYHKYGDCGDGCQSLENAWNLFSIDQDGAKNNQIRYVRGANAYGCPVFLDVPPTLDEYWYAGWRQDGDGNKQFGYYQAAQRPELPTDADGNYLVASQDPVTKQPIMAPLPPSNFDNLLANLASKVTGSFTKIQETPAFTADINGVTGAFQIKWNDWWPNLGVASDHIGGGTITGVLHWTIKGDSATGSLIYNIQSIEFQTLSYKLDKGPRGYSGSHNLTIKGVAIPSGTETIVLDKYLLPLDQDWSISISKVIDCNQTITLAPGQSSIPYTFCYVYNDWTPFDDEGYLQATFHNTLQGWN